MAVPTPAGFGATTEGLPLQGFCTGSQVVPGNLSLEALPPVTIALPEPRNRVYSVQFNSYLWEANKKPGFCFNIIPATAGKKAPIEK